MSKTAKPITILMAEDDEADRLLVEEALEESRMANEVIFVKDGTEVFEFLEQAGKTPDHQLPDLILMDLNMPKLDGREALERLKASEEWRRIPVVVLTTSQAEEDIISSYDSGAAGFISKPVNFEGLIHIIKGLETYWVQIVKLP